jgi:hypothetical protein
VQTNTYEQSERERQFALSCPQPVECPPLPCLTLKHAKTLNTLRIMPKQLIAASAQTISPSPRRLDVVGDAPAAPIERNASADRSWFDMSANAVSACSDFAGNSALDLPRSRSSGIIVAAESARSRSGLGTSEATTAESKSSFRGIKKDGASPFTMSRRLRLRT